MYNQDRLNQVVLWLGKHIKFLRKSSVQDVVEVANVFAVTVLVWLVEESDAQCLAMNQGVPPVMVVETVANVEEPDILQLILRNIVM